jgi:hypothetical protein
MILFKVKDTEAHRVSRKAATILYRMVDWGQNDIFVTPFSTLGGGRISRRVQEDFTRWMDGDILEAVDA